MSFDAMLADPAWRGELTKVPAADLLHGALAVEGRPGGWARPRRFLDAQLHALGSCVAWHPGLYRQMSRTSAGVCVEFDTNSSEIALEVRTPGLSHAVRELVAGVPGANEASFDGVACEVDGALLPLSWGVPLPVLDPEEPQVASGMVERLVCFSLLDERELPAAGVLPLPGLGESHHVRLWLPCLHEVELRRVWGDGSELAARPARPLLLVLGDGSAQGAEVADAASTWPVRLAERAGLDLVNQGLMRQVFQPSALAGLTALADVAAVVVELGEGYRQERCSLREASRDVRGFLATLSRTLPDAPVWVVVPEEGEPVQAGSCLAELVAYLVEQATAHGMRCVSPSDLAALELDAS